MFMTALCGRGCPHFADDKTKLRVSCFPQVTRDLAPSQRSGSVQ